MGKVKKCEPQKKPLTTNQKWKALKPERPTRPTGRYATFVAEFSKGKCDAKGPEFFRAASSAWAKLDNNAKMEYDDADALAKYREEMEAYQKISQAMKRPGESYAFFVQHYFLTKKPKVGSKAQFGRIQKDISKLWAKTTDEVKSPFRAAAEALQMIFEEERKAVLSGERELNVNWREEGITKVSRILNKEYGKSGGVRPDPNEEEQQEDEKQQRTTRPMARRSPTTRGNSRAAQVPSPDEEDMSLHDNFDKLLGSVLNTRK